MNITINDSLGHTRTLTEHVEVFIPLAGPLNFNFTNAEGTAKNVTFKFFRPRTNFTLFNFTNSSVNYGGNALHQRLYDLEIGTYGHTFFLEGFNLTGTYVDINIDDINDTVNFTNFKILSGVGVNSSYTGNGTLNLSYSFDEDTAAVTEDNLSVYKCDNWNYTARDCVGDFESYDNVSVRIGDNVVVVNVTSFSGYVVSEGTCGNSVCQAAYGETTDTCVADV